MDAAEPAAALVDGALAALRDPDSALPVELLVRHAGLAGKKGPRGSDVTH